MKKRMVFTGIFLMSLILFFFLPRQNVMTVNVMETFQQSSRDHILGTDNLGRDVYSLLVEGGLRTLQVVFLASAISFSFGTVLGMAAAYSGRALRGIIQFAADFTLIIPSFISALIFSALFGFSPLTAGVVFGLGNMGEYVNQSYGMTVSLRKRVFMEGIIVLGARNPRILCFHVFPNICRQLFVFLGNRASNVTIQYAGLAFIGLGTDVTNPDWGSLLYQYRVYLLTCPRLVLWPALAIAALSLFFHYMFDEGGSDEEMTIYD